MLVLEGSESFVDIVYWVDITRINQSFAENCYSTIKADTNGVLNQSGTSADCWLLALEYVCHVLNLLASATLG
jgi:hypothetical protein